MASCTKDSEDFSLASSDSNSETSDSDAEEECLEFCNISLSLSAITLKEVLERIQQDKTVLCCSLGEDISQAAVKCLQHISAPDMENFAAIVVGDLRKMLGSGDTKRKIKLSNFWRHFHILRLSPTVRQAWHSCTTSLDIPSTIEGIMLQAILKRIVLNILHKVQKPDPAQFIPTERMTEREENIVRYMAGYVASKVQKKYPTVSNQVEFKEDDTLLYFTGDDMQDYSEIWTKQIDRGGLYHISDNFYNFTVALEYKCRKYLDTRLPPASDVGCKIRDDCLSSPHIEKLWLHIISPSASPKTSKEILMYIIRLWTNIRTYSFTKKWSAQLLSQQKDKAHTRSLRKGLKLKGTEKES